MAEALGYAAFYEHAARMGDDLQHFSGCLAWAGADQQRTPDLRRTPPLITPASQ
jgi:hypothetical protein